MKKPKRLTDKQVIRMLRNELKELGDLCGFTWMYLASTPATQNGKFTVSMAHAAENAKRILEATRGR